MKLKNILFAFAATLMAASCYEDLGNYDYREINEVQIAGIDDFYARDMEEMLVIRPQITGTLYDDPQRFTYEWVIVSDVVSTALDLEYLVSITPGTKVCRFIITDKETGVKAFHRFTLNVSSSTAGDLVMVLSKYQGRAELSYLRLLRPEEVAAGKQANWAVNYYQNRFEHSLGANPTQLAIIYCESARSYPFVNQYGRIMALVDNRLSLIDKNTLEPVQSTSHLTGEAYTGISSFPPAHIEGYESQFVLEGFNIWRSDAYGTGFQLACHVVEVSGGRMYFAFNLAPGVWTASFFPNVASPYGANGYISPFVYWDDMRPEPHSHLQQLGYILGHLICFDQTHGRFFSSFAYGSPAQIPLESIPAFPGMRMMWGSATSIADNSSVAVLTNGSNCRLVLIRNTGTGIAAKAMTGTVDGGIITPDSRFYTMQYTNYMFFSAGDRLYLYNILDIASDLPPSERNRVFRLSDFGYGPEARITDICVSRTERTMLVGVSRYGSDSDAMGDEPLGDLLWFDLDASSLTLTHNAARSATGIAGIPVDVQIKYQTHWRDGEYMGEIKDTI